jgi:hypothetical protein
LSIIIWNVVRKPFAWVGAMVKRMSALSSRSVVSGRMVKDPRPPEGIVLDNQDGMRLAVVA